MQALSTWPQTQLGSLSGLLSSGYEAIPQDPTSTHSAVYSFVDSDEFIYDGSEWDDDITRSDKKADETNNSSLDKWGDYSGSWESPSAKPAGPNPKSKASPKSRKSQSPCVVIEIQQLQANAPGVGFIPDACRAREAISTWLGRRLLTNNVCAGHFEHAPGLPAHVGGFKAERFMWAANLACEGRWADRKVSMPLCWPERCRHGQASPTACLLCQARCMQCDEGKPGCARCERMRINCPGYGESQKKRRGSPPNKNTARRQAQGDAGARKQPVPFVGQRWVAYTEKLESRWRHMSTCPDEAFENDGKFTVMLPTPFGTIPTCVEVPIADRARAFFLDSYVRAPTRPGERGSNSFILSILGSGSIVPCFEHAFRAASLAALSTRLSFRRPRAQAQVEYIRAIRAVSDAMQSLARGEESKTQTLASVLLMAIYETLACPSQQIDAFEAHVRGAVQLIKLLGMENLQTPECKEMLILARGLILALKVLPGHETSFTDTLMQSLMPVGYHDMLGQLGLLMASLAWQRGRMVQAIESGQYGPGVFLDAADSFERGDTIPEILTRMRTSTSAAPGYGAPCTPTQDGV
ncbi:hypothetical protein GGTG_08953 [Gaeumannomyces tritici R3-111a-1]|uniref:Zn(2)-C6 fungal-type domain-containing protein n=1 Tax=Gaeumannomyces tritici (strain R3-111a-1) TaxID=644352 RepID=J3P613_GAET3|nr:hypothetical protein GGTG_08953 [Gaeumannomyces tritici R3-111a-1]EJT75115.1 hypothetical protein GGTG_08953 [Gaeumannomyces tritici R3-111a-1]